ncbi:hypothetical protein FHS89_003267, partial [Rubricella aquisinus]
MTDLSQLSAAEKRALLTRLRAEKAALGGPKLAPVSFAQRRFWLLERMLSTPGAYNMPIAVEIDGEVSADALRRALDRLVARHEALRTTIVEVDGTPMQKIAATGQCPLDIAEHPDAEQAQSALTEHAWAAFDLAKRPPIRALLIQRAPACYWLQIVLHHAMGDAWSLNILMGELTQAYAAEIGGVPFDPAPIGTSYADFAIRQAAEKAQGRLAGGLAYWEQQLSAPPVLSLPSDIPRPVVQQMAADTVPITLTQAETDAVKHLAERTGATLFMVLMAIYQMALMRISGQTDLIVGAPSAGRDAAGLEQTIGCFVNTIAVRTRADDDPVMTDWIARVRDRVLDALAHQNVPFEEIVDQVVKTRDPARPTLVQAMLTLPNIAQHDARAALPVRAISANAPTTRFDLECHLREGPAGLEGEIYYPKATFSAAEITRLRDLLTALLRAAPSALHERLSRIAPPTLPTQSYGQRNPQPDVSLIVHLTPGDEIALEQGDQRLTRTDLQGRVEALSRCLVGMGVCVGGYVGVLTSGGFGFV